MSLSRKILRGSSFSAKYTITEASDDRKQSKPKPKPVRTRKMTLTPNPARGPARPTKRPSGYPPAPAPATATAPAPAPRLPRAPPSRKQGWKEHMRIAVASVLFLVMWAATTMSKVSLTMLLGGHFITNVQLETWYATLALVLIVPELVALVKVFWNTSFIKRTPTHQWPSALAIFVGLMVSFAEVSSFLVFTLEVAPRLPVQVLLPLLSSVFSVFLCHKLWEDVRVKFIRTKKSEMAYDGNFTLAHRHGDDPRDCPDHDGTLHTWKRLLKTVVGFSGVWASCAIASILALTTTLPWFQALCLPACLCLLSLCWHPKVRVYIVRSTDGGFLGRWKATCLYTFFKIVILLVGLSLLMVIRLQTHNVMDRRFFVILYEGLKNCRHSHIFYPLLIHFLSGITGHVVSYMAATLCLTGIGVSLPTLLATPTAVALVLYLCQPQFSILDDVMCYSHGAGIWCACILACITWAAPYVISGKNFMCNAEVIMKPFDELFIEPTWNNIFFDQHLILNYQPDGFICAHRMLTTYADAMSRVFICTTMYREADFEMSRLLKSIHKVSQSSVLKNVYMEAHIFLDQGAQDSHLTDFSSQLLSLLHSTMGITSAEAHSFQTPYGIQLNWSLAGGMPFSIHLKDAMKVKVRKRWSQVMYMSYILNYRMMRDIQPEKLGPLLSRSMRGTDESIFVGYASDKEWQKNFAALNNTHLGTNDKKQGCIKDSPTLSINTTGSETPFYVRESRESLAKIFSIEGMDLVADSTNLGSKGKGLMSSLRPEILQQISSDQGIGNSDNISMSSFSSLQDETGSSEEMPSGHGTVADRNDKDYEGDFSSNNESSLTSLRAQQAQNFLCTNKELPISEIIPQFCQVTCEKPLRHKRPQHPPRHTKSRSRRDSKPPSIPCKKGSPCGSKAPKRLCRKDTTLGSSTNKVSPGFAVSRKSVPSKASMNRKRLPLDDHTYILATDGDMEFDADSVKHLLELCNKDRRLGGACGRTHPIGQKTGPLVWYQKFEYAKDFWMIKSAQNVIGSVMCCPGCFSLYRAGAVRDVLSHYSGPSSKSYEVFVKDSGEDRWLCTLMMLNGWKLEYTAFCNNTTYCPDGFTEFVKQRRRWVLSDLANMLLVFQSIIKLAQKNDSFSIAYILYMLQMFIIVLLSPASTVVILAGGLDIVYGIPFQITSSSFGVLVIAYALICLVGSQKTQTRVTFFLTIILGIAMLLVVIGGMVYVFYDISADIQSGSVEFQEYYLILMLVCALGLAALLHPRETWLLVHGLSYLLGFPAMQILLPVYAICNMVDQSWGTRDSNKSKSPPVSCFSKQRKKYHSSLSRSSRLSGEEVNLTLEEEEEPELPVECTTQFQPMKDGQGPVGEEYSFWERIRHVALGNTVNVGLQGAPLDSGLRTLRNVCLLAMIFLNAAWLLLLSMLYFNADVLLARVNIYGLIAAAVYGLVLFVQLLGMSVHRVQALFNRFGTCVFGKTRATWIYPRNRL